MAAVHLVGVDAEPLAGVASRPDRWEHPVVAAQEVLRRRIRPGLEGPRLPQRLRSLVSFSPPRLGCQLGRDVVVEDVLVPALLIAGARPPVPEELPRRRNHRRNEDKKAYANADAHKRRREAAERVAHDDDLATV